jgi:hypothetical protein
VNKKDVDMWLRNSIKLDGMLNLDVKEHYSEIVKHLANHEAPLDYLVSGELAQIQTFGIPSISKLLHRTKQYEEHSVKRLDDTRAILTECMMDSVESPRGAHMVKHLNWIHSHYDISNDDYLYTLALFIVEPERWMNTFGYRALTEKEKQAGFLAFKSLGKAMNIENIPETREEFIVWYLNYRRQQMTFHPDNKSVTDGFINGVRDMFPFFLKPFIKSMILTLINDPEVLAATGQKEPKKIVQVMIRGLMTIRKVTQKFINPWQNQSFETSRLGQSYKSYPNGFQNCVLGPEKIVKNANGGCPYTKLKEMLK